MRIGSFRHKGLKRPYEADDPRGVRADFALKLKIILHAIGQAQRVEQVAKLPGWRVHPLKGKRKSEWSIVVTSNYRLAFRVDGDDVRDIDLEDYH